MQDYEFTSARIIGWQEHIGVTIQPPIEIMAEQEKFAQFSSTVRKRFPSLFDRMVLSDNKFEMMKSFAYPGKPEITALTFSLTPQGPVFIFPRRLPQFDLEPDLPDINNTFVQCMKIFKKTVGGYKIKRVGKVNKFLFSCEIHSLRLVAGRFTRITIPDDGELRIRFNQHDGKMNRIFTIQPVEEFVQAGSSTPPKRKGYAIEVSVDVNNRAFQEDMDESDWLSVLGVADLFAKDGMYETLNV